MCDKRRGWKTHVPFHTCPLSHVFTFDCQTADQRDGGRGGKGGAGAFTSLKSYQSVFVKDFSGETPTASARRPNVSKKPLWLL